MNSVELCNLLNGINRRGNWVFDRSSGENYIFGRPVSPSEGHISHRLLIQTHNDLKRLVPNFLVSNIPVVRNVEAVRYQRIPGNLGWSIIRSEVIGTVPDHFTHWTVPVAEQAFPKFALLGNRYTPIHFWDSFISANQSLMNQLIWFEFPFDDSVHVIRKEQTGDGPEFVTSTVYSSDDLRNYAYQQNYYTYEVRPEPLYRTCSYWEIPSPSEKFPVEITLWYTVTAMYHTDTTHYAELGNTSTDYQVPTGLFTREWNGRTVTDNYSPYALLHNSESNARAFSVTATLHPGEKLRLGQENLSNFAVPETFLPLLQEAQIRGLEMPYQCTGGNIWTYLCGVWRALL